ncbi:MAG: protein kinase [Verrucomicrobiota bacterium]|nr:protein kinase [Verrucomicrobiota bacterium]
MGITYLARDNVLNRKVAIKVVALPRPAHEAQAVRERFLREARAAAAFRHPNVASVFHFGASPDGGCYYAMELVEGDTLEAIVRRDGPLTVRAALEVAVQVTRALIAAAAQGLIHRDLKPSNMMLGPNEAAAGDEWLVKVIDFGLAKAVMENGRETDLTRGGFVGTPTFASPEQCGGVIADARSDIYSLGATLWYALTGEAPFAGRTVEEIRQCQRELALPVERLTARKVPRPVIQLLSKLLASEPSERPSSARAVMDLLDSCRARLGLRSATGHKPWSQWKFVALAAASIATVLTFFAYRSIPRVLPIPLLPAKSIAVLPFENLSVEEENGLLAQGVQEDIITALSRLADLKVISRSSVVGYRGGATRNLREIGQALGVAHILEGTFRRAGDKVRVTIQLVHAPQEARLWTESYDRPLQDVLALPGEIALQVAARLHTMVTLDARSAIGERSTDDLAAYDLYLRARALTDIPRIDSDNLTKAVVLLEQAVQRDPNFFLAYCLLVRTHAWIYTFADHTPERKALALEALDNVTRLRPDAGETHVARAEFFTNVGRDYAKARSELAVAQRALPREARIFSLLGGMDKRQGEWESSIHNSEKALELNPRSLIELRWLSNLYRRLGRFPEAAATMSRAQTVDPSDVGLKVLRAALELDWRADTKPLRRVFSTLEEKDPVAASMYYPQRFDLALCERDPVAIERAVAGMDQGFSEDALLFSRDWYRGLAARTRGDGPAARNAFSSARVQAEEQVASHPDFGPPLCVLALIDAALGNKEEAIREGRRASELLPTTKDATNGGSIITYLAVIYAWTGEKDLAIAQLTAAMRVYNEKLTYGLLRLHPLWDPLRGDPRFEKLVEDRKPKPAD